LSHFFIAFGRASAAAAFSIAFFTAFIAFIASPSSWQSLCETIEMRSTTQTLNQTCSQKHQMPAHPLHHIDCKSREHALMNAHRTDLQPAHARIPRVDKMTRTWRTCRAYAKIKTRTATNTTHNRNHRPKLSQFEK